MNKTQEDALRRLVDRIDSLRTTNAALLEALETLVDAKYNYEIVGRDDTGHPLNEIGVARMIAREAIRKAKGG